MMKKLEMPKMIPISTILLQYLSKDYLQKYTWACSRLDQKIWKAWAHPGLTLKARAWLGLENFGLVPPLFWASSEYITKVNRVNKYRLHQRCLDDITTLPQFSGMLGSAWHWWHRVSAFLKAGQFSEHLWSSQVNSLCICGPKLTLLFIAEGWSAQPYYVTFGA